MLEGNLINNYMKSCFCNKANQTEEDELQYRIQVPQRRLVKIFNSFPFSKQKIAQNMFVTYFIRFIFEKQKNSKASF